MIIKGDLKYKKIKKVTKEKDKTIKNYRYEAYYYGTKILETKFYLKKKLALNNIKKISKEYLRSLKQEFKNNNNECEEGEIESHKIYKINNDDENSMSFLPEQLEYNNSLTHSRTYVVYLNQFFQKFKIDYEYSFDNFKNLYICKLRVDNKVFVTDVPFIRKIDAKENVSKKACDYLKII
ncbi:hypothetical protein H8356DRAFT_1639851 [Neocallimastix lanati (nom. inval.)]|nr:hypothetical protein H8356DRAFT_1639851 [Neocallimastix sp. JGI-2020a]